jgi:hypothetical protein
MATATIPVPKLFYPTTQKTDVLKALAKYEVLTIRDLAELLFKKADKVTLSSVVRTTRLLERHGLVNRIYFRPEEYRGEGLLPFACGLSEEGVQFAQDNFPNTDPKLFRKDHSPHTIEHELKRARFHIKVSEMCKKNGLELFWRKTDLNHTVKPDDVFAIKKDGKITYYFFELENKKKSFKEMLEKYKRYEDYYGTEKCKQEWKDFKTFTVVTQIRTDEARLNLLRFLSGEPVTEYRNGHGRTIVNPTPIKRSNFWFCAESDPFSFKTPKDFERSQYSFLN